MGAFNGDAGDSMRENQNQKLTTYDRGNDAWEEKNCAVEFMGSWWYTDCTYSLIRKIPVGPCWTVIARRTNGDLNFFRSWQECKKGFGDIAGDFFIGLDKLHVITKSQTHVLYVHLEDFEGNTRYAQYDEFFIESENQLYRLTKLGAFTGDAGDSLSSQKGHNFTTYDRDNDIKPETNCALDYMGPWWHKHCTYSNLFAIYVNGTVSSMERKGVNWAAWRGFAYSLKVIQMMVRPKYTCSV
ncbi:techylectin-5B [Drosophila persimilis]|uniref:techylectin-5B n=1 Tax=Drosophila persimilis TaxID=7234 RepID=UPI000F07BD87|nr:techylectin-5B [Drosophila persimilis]